MEEVRSSNLLCSTIENKKMAKRPIFYSLCWARRCELVEFGFRRSRVKTEKYLYFGFSEATPGIVLSVAKDVSPVLHQKIQNDPKGHFLFSAERRDANSPSSDSIGAERKQKNIYILDFPRRLLLKKKAPQIQRGGINCSGLRKI